MIARFTLMIAALALMSPGALAQSASPAESAAYFGTHASLQQPARPSNLSLWRIRMASLQREGRELQQRDGGTLTPEHRAMLQARLDDINAQYRRD